MSLNCIGTTPDGGSEYECGGCRRVFGYQSQDSEGEPTYEEPKYCPGCGKGDQ